MVALYNDCLFSTWLCSWKWQILLDDTFLTFVGCHDSMLCYQVNWVKLCLRYLFYVTNESINNGVSGFENREVQIMHEEQERIKKKKKKRFGMLITIDVNVL